MSDVVRFPEAKTVIWVCGCGCTSFELLGDLTARCVLCGAKPTTEVGGWFPSEKGQAWIGDLPTSEVASNEDGTGFMRRLASRRAAQENVVLTLACEDTGRLHLWADAHDEEQRQWARDRLASAIEMLGPKE